MTPPAAVELEPWIHELSLIQQDAERRACLETISAPMSVAVVESLYKAVMTLLRVDLLRAERLALACAVVAAEIHDPYALAQSERALGHVHHFSGRHTEAIRHYEQAIDAYRNLGRELDVAATSSALTQSLSYTGQYERAFALGESARAVLTRHNDVIRLGRLDANIANILYRQDRFQEAVELYERSARQLEEQGADLDITLLMRNVAVCYISLNDFTRAENSYQLSRTKSVEQGLPLLVVEADYNIAYLYYLRGEYLRAIELYDKTRESCRKFGDKYHQALCDLDQSEIYLELNLTESGEQMAHAAFEGFKELGLRYEAAKAATFSAIALSQQGHTERALGLFDEARGMFIEEKNQLWPALINLYKALVLYDAESDDAAYELAASALDYFASSPLPAKAAICELLLAAIELRYAGTEAARGFCSSALARLINVESPATYQAYFMLGQVEEASQNVELARQAYDQAYRKLEDLRSSLGREELKIAFLKNKLAIYEGLVVTSLTIEKGSKRSQKAFEYIEQAKSRSLADLIAFRAPSFHSRSPEHSAAMEQLRELRQKLNWVYHQIELEELNPGERSLPKIQRLRQQGRQLEDSVMKSFSGIQGLDQEFTGLGNAETLSVAELQSRLPAETMLVEFYSAREWLYVCLVTADNARIFPVAEVRQVREELRLLQLQLAKFRLGEEHIRPFEKMLLQATNSHLENLYALLITPLRQYLEAPHLIIVPHAFLHYLPFHALCHEGRALIDDYSISYAPSGSVFALCQQKQSKTAGESLVLAVPDQRAPYIREEAEFVAAALKNARLFVGEEATEQKLRDYGPQSRFIHIATHGYFRQDNPMFSSLRLGDSLLSLFDLYQLRLDAELVTLSGCGTGMNVVIGGDELIGLVRGLLYAGAQTLMVSLWEVHDQSTAEFMRDFYRFYAETPNKANALRRAVLSLRERRPHPYYWAAFALVGKIS
jgi:CHAT domain-containing protein